MKPKTEATLLVTGPVRSIEVIGRNNDVVQVNMLRTSSFNKNGQPTIHNEWFNVRFYNRTAGFILSSVREGDVVNLQAEPRTDDNGRVRYMGRTLTLIYSPREQHSAVDNDEKTSPHPLNQEGVDYTQNAGDYSASYS